MFPSFSAPIGTISPLENSRGTSEVMDRYGYDAQRHTDSVQPLLHLLRHEGMSSKGSSRIISFNGVWLGQVVACRFL